jgi:hypothetical protein
MKINEIKIERKYNLGNYETIGISVSIAPEPEETTIDQIKEHSKKLTQLIEETKKEVIK